MDGILAANSSSTEYISHIKNWKTEFLENCKHYKNECLKNSEGLSYIKEKLKSYFGFEKKHYDQVDKIYNKMLYGQEFPLKVTADEINKIAGNDNLFEERLNELANDGSLFNENAYKDEGYLRIISEMSQLLSRSSSKESDPEVGKNSTTLNLDPEKKIDDNTKIAKTEITELDKFLGQYDKLDGMIKASLDKDKTPVIYVDVDKTIFYKTPANKKTTMDKILSFFSSRKNNTAQKQENQNHYPKIEESKKLHNSYNFDFEAGAENPYHLEFNRPLIKTLKALQEKYGDQVKVKILSTGGWREQPVKDLLKEQFGLSIDGFYNKQDVKKIPGNNKMKGAFSKGFALGPKSEQAKQNNEIPIMIDDQWHQRFLFGFSLDPGKWFRFIFSLFRK